MEFTEEQQDKILLLSGWEKTTGYAMGYEAPESANIIISVDEIKKFICTKPTCYYFPQEDGEYMRELEEA